MSKELKTFFSLSMRELRMTLQVSVFFIVAAIAISACSLHGERGGWETPVAITPYRQQGVASPSKTGPVIIAYAELLDSNNWLVADYDCIWRTEDGGRTWAESYREKAGAATEQRIRGLSFVDDKTGFLILGRRVLRTHDGGGSWDEVGELNFDADGCYFTDESHGWAVGRVWLEEFMTNSKAPQCVGTIFNTEDGGRTWRQQRVRLPQGYFEEGTRWYLSDVFFTDQRKGWAVGFGVIFWTIDGGESWHVAEAEKRQYGHVRFLDDQFGWATQQEGEELAITTDGGLHWRSFSGPPTYGSHSTSAVFLTPKQGFAVLIKLYKTEDGGRTWRVAGGTGPSEGYDYLGKTRDVGLVALGLHNDTLTVLTSVDNGITWQPNR